MRRGRKTISSVLGVVGVEGVRRVVSRVGVVGVVLSYYESNVCFDDTTMLVIMMAKSSMAGLRIMHEDSMKSSVGTMGYHT